VFEAHCARDVSERILRQLVGHRIVIDKVNRASQHGTLESLARRRLGAQFKLTNKLRQEIAKL